MKKTTLIAIALLLVATLAPMAVYAQSADAQTWSTAITYYTPDATGGQLQIKYYPEGSSTSIDATPITLSGHKAGSLFIGNVGGMPATFAGSAVLEADVPIVATAVNIAGSDYPRPLYSGFDPSQASENFFIPTVLYQKFNTNSLVSIQNVETSDINATLKVYAPGAATPTSQQTYPIKAQSAVLIPAADMSLPAGFTGSAVVEATGGKVVAAAQENEISGRGAKAFEGLASDAGAPTVYMASMMCQAFAGNTSFYAIQNVDGAQATVEIDFYDKNGTKLYTATGLSISPGGKISENPCKYTASAPALQGVSGSAVIRSTNGQDLIAIGKISGGGLTPTAFLGQSAGAKKIAAPYIRWKSDPAAGERSFVAVMNVGSAAATNVTATYYDNQGNAAATATLASAGSPLNQFIKVNTNWSTASGGNTDFGVNPYGGAIEISSDQDIVVVVRVSKNVSFGGTTKFAEDYNGAPVP
jgi:hypothetical protein